MRLFVWVCSKHNQRQKKIFELTCLPISKANRKSRPENNSITHAKKHQRKPNPTLTTILQINGNLRSLKAVTYIAINVFFTLLCLLVVELRKIPLFFCIRDTTLQKTNKTVACLFLGMAQQN